MHYSEFNTEPVLMSYPDNKQIESFSQTQKLADLSFRPLKGDQLSLENY
jgi:hypothetical protein